MIFLNTCHELLAINRRSFVKEKKRVWNKIPSSGELKRSVFDVISVEQFSKRLIDGILQKRFTRNLFNTYWQENSITPMQNSKK
jgi:hypothetical protein